jgi:hypothetical protein
VIATWYLVDGFSPHDQEDRLSQYRLEREIPPSEVTIDLLRQLEKVILDDIAARFTLSSEEKQLWYSIDITDAFGTETLTTIDAYRPSVFPDTTTAVVVSLLRMHGAYPRIAVRLAFNLRLTASVLRVDAEDDAAREIATGIADRLLQVLAPHRGTHAFFHPGPVAWGMWAFFLIGAVITPICLSATGIIPISDPRYITVSMVASIVAVLCLAYWLVGYALRPYIIFDSRRNRGRTSLWNWFIYGLLTFVVFTTLLLAFRKYWLGF